MKRSYVLLVVIALVMMMTGWWMLSSPVIDGSGDEIANKYPLPANKASQNSDQKLYQVTFSQAKGKPSVGPISLWHASVRDQNGNPVENARILVEGGMPGHGHGLPTSPAVTGKIKPGIYAIDGVKFSMPGLWQFRLTIKADAGEEAQTFNIVLE